MPIYDTRQETAGNANSGIRFSISVAASVVPHIENHSMLVVLGYASASGTPSLISADFGDSDFKLIATDKYTAIDVVVNAYYSANVSKNSRALNFEFDRSAHAVVNVVGFAGVGREIKYDIVRYDGSTTVKSPKSYQEQNKETMCVLSPFYGGSLIDNVNCGLWASDSDIRVLGETYCAGGLVNQGYKGKPTLYNVSSGPTNGFLCFRMIINSRRHEDEHGVGDIVEEREKHLERMVEESNVTDEEKKKKVAENEAVIEEGAASMEGEIIALEQQAAEEQRARLDEHRNVIANIIEAMQEQRKVEVAEQQRWYEEQQAAMAEQRKLENALLAEYNEEQRKKTEKEAEAERQRIANMVGRSKLLSILRRR
ncbi:MAG: cell envelope integrity inner membrane protein [Podoviridae sp. ctQNx1]|nr:MAG: cell envelope integrity inner membrane protein [Podoviridae sp. ctQNx1]UOF78097.1 cell envelope integrity inner membrane protein [Caudoviricetes sp.]